MTTSGRVLLADDSPHAQRMGERILREEGYEVVTVTDGETAIIRLKDVDPDVVIVDAFLPQVSGYDLCGFIKKQPQHSHVKVVLTSTALEKVDEDHAYKVGADGQLKKPFEASVMLKSLKDLIGGSEKKKRAGTTLDLSYSPEEMKPADSAPSQPAAEETAAEKPVTALQAWLQQHDSGAFSEEPEPEEATVAEAAADAEEEAPAAMSRLSNPQLLRKPEEEPEDLSLRNNPVAKRWHGSGGSAPAERQVEPENLMDAGGDAGRGSVRQFRSQPAASAAPAAVPEAPRTPRKSLLEQLEEFERASQADEPIPDEFPSKPAASAAAEEASEPAAKAMESVSAAKPEASVAANLDEELSALAKAEAEASSEDDEEFRLMRDRKSRSSRISLLEALGEVAEPQAAVEESPAEETVAPEPVAVLEPEAAAEEEVLATGAGPMASEQAAEAATAAAETAVVSLGEAGVRLDEEEVRAVVEIAVSAAMPAIVEEVARCVRLALESRYADKMAMNGDSSAH